MLRRERKEGRGEGRRGKKYFMPALAAASSSSFPLPFECRGGGEVGGFVRRRLFFFLLPFLLLFWAILAKYIALLLPFPFPSSLNSFRRRSREEGREGNFSFLGRSFAVSLTERENLSPKNWASAEKSVQRKKNFFGNFK